MNTKPMPSSLTVLFLIAALFLPNPAGGATEVPLYQTSFEAPAFTPGLPIRDQDNWQMFHDGEAISIATNNARTGLQCVRMEGALLEQTGPNSSRAYCFSRALEGATNPAPIVEIRASVRLDGPRTGANGTPDQDILSANLMAAVTNSPTTAAYLGGFFVSSAGRIWNYSPVPVESYRYSVSYTQGTYRTLALRVDFVARRVTYLVDGVTLGSTPFPAGVVSDRLYSGYLELAGPIDPIQTPELNYDRANYTAHFDDYSLVAIPLSPVNAVIEFGPADFFGSINSSPDVLVTESMPTARLNVIRRGFTNAAVRVTVTTTNGTAIAGEDFDAVSTFVTFAAGQTNQTVEIALRDDYWPEPDKEFTVGITGLPPGATSGQPVARVLIRDDERPGGIDSSWSSALGLPPLGSNQSRYADPHLVIQQPDGKLILDISVWGSEDDFTYPLYWHLLRINPDGSVDPTYPIRDSVAAAPGGHIPDRHTTVMPDGKVLVWDYEDRPGTASLGYRLRYQLNPDGSQDNTFTNVIVAMGTLDLVPTSDGKILMNGAHWYSPNLLGGIQVTNLVRLNNDGSLDPTFTPPPGLEFVALWPLTNGQILANSGVWPQPPKLYRLNANGSLDNGFTVGIPEGGSAPFGTQISALIPLPDGGIVVVGSFRTFNGQVRNSIVRLNANGSIDPTFQTGTGFLGNPQTGNTNDPGVVAHLWPLAGGRFLVGSTFDGYAMLFNGQKVTPPVILNSNGRLDSTFVASAVPAGYTGVAGGNLYFLTGYGLGRLNMDLSLRIVSAAHDGDGTHHVTANALAGRSYTLQVSEDLSNWGDLTTQSATTNRIEFTDAPASLPAKRFYRVKQN
jgi:uncharacterized delta-60 repeat protein